MAKSMSVEVVSTTQHSLMPLKPPCSVLSLLYFYVGGGMRGLPFDSFRGQETVPIIVYTILKQKYVTKLLRRTSITDFPSGHK
jgi:hypothetical protein